MGTVFRKTVTRPMPSEAEIVVHKGVRLAKWKTRQGKSRTAPLTTGENGAERIVTTAGTFTAKYRDGQGIVREVATGCRDEQAARRVLGDLERRAELIKSGVMTAAEDAIADHRATPLGDHIALFHQQLQSKGAGAGYCQTILQYLCQVSQDCGWSCLQELSRPPLEKWLAEQAAQGRSARSRNAYRNALVSFGNWCVENNRLTVNPFARVAKANERADQRRQRRAMTEAELICLLEVARLRPLAEEGRTPVQHQGEVATAKRKRSNWTYAELTFDDLPAAIKRAQERLVDNADRITKLERLGHERALIYKTLVLTGLRKGELASLTVGQLELDALVPCAVLNAADEKNRQGNSIPIRADLAEDLRGWLQRKLDHVRSEALRAGQRVPSALRADTPLFDVPAGLVRILDRDLQVAGIAKRDERGRTIDVHALRHSFGTLLSKGGVAPRTAQAALRHSTIDLTMNVYTDPKLLDVQGALESLPRLPLGNTNPAEGRVVQKSVTGEGRASLVAPTVAPNSYLSSPSESIADNLTSTVAFRDREQDELKNPCESSEKALSAEITDKALEIGMAGFEPTTSCTPS